MIDFGQIEGDPSLVHTEHDLRPLMTQQEKSLTQDRKQMMLHFTPVCANTLKFGTHNQVNPRFAMKYIVRAMEAGEPGAPFTHMNSQEEVERVMNEFGRVAKNVEEQLRQPANWN